MDWLYGQQDGQTWLTDETDRCDGHTWWTDVMDGSDGQMWQTDMTDGCDGRTWWTDVMKERRHGTVWKHCSRAGCRAGAAMNLNHPDCQTTNQMTFIGAQPIKWVRKLFVVHTFYNICEWIIRHCSCSHFCTWMETLTCGKFTLINRKMRLYWLLINNYLQCFASISLSFSLSLN